MLTLKLYVGVFSEIFQARILKLGIHMDNELLYYGIENRTVCSYSSLYLSIFYPVFFVFVSFENSCYSFLCNLFIAPYI